MNGIQDKMRQKEEARLARKKAAGGEQNPDDMNSDAYSSDASSDD